MGRKKGKSGFPSLDETRPVDGVAGFREEFPYPVLCPVVGNSLFLYDATYITLHHRYEGGVTPGQWGNGKGFTGVWMNLFRQHARGQSAISNPAQ